jgi:uncharacterized membrane protein YkvA (DUF1232 family)
MAPIESRCLDAFPDWLRTLSEDAVLLSSVVTNGGAAEPLRRRIAGALNYLFKSLDLIPDGIEDLGYLDDAFVFRVAADLAVKEGGASDALTRLAKEAELVREFLGADYARLERFVTSLGAGVARGRSVDDIVSTTSVATALAGDVKGWAGSYGVPTFARDTKNLVKLKSFLAAKLPA